jgi:hypothetical protein
MYGATMSVARTMRFVIIVCLFGILAAGIVLLAAITPGQIAFRATPLPMTVRNGATGEKHLIETMIAGVAAFDYDGDGWPDIFVANGASVPDLRKTGATYSNRLFRNNHDKTFTDVTERAGLAGEGYSMGVAAGDFDNDGHIDLLVTGVRSNHLYRNLGDGTFRDVTAAAGLSGDAAWSVAAGWFDFDNDGLLDLFVVHYVKWTAAADTFCGVVADRANNKPGFRQYCNPRHYEPLPNTLYHNLGNGRFEDVSASSGIAAFQGKGMGVTFGDYDNDGQPDIFVANDTMPNFLFHNEGSGKYRNVAVEAGVAYNDNGKPISSMGADLRDYDNDGREDLFLTALPDETFPLFRNIGNGRFADMTYATGIAKASLPFGGWSAGLYDLDNDGWKDIFVAGGHVMDNAEASSARKSREPNLVFRNLGGRKFAALELPGAALHRGAAFADFDRDGRIDAVVTSLNEAPQVLWNETVHAGHWLDLHLTGTKNNRDGIGAMVHISSASGQQWNRAETSSGYGGSSDRIVHFGLANDSSVDRIEIIWPGGAKQILENVTCDQLLSVVQNH